MFATSWRWAWGAAPFSLWSRRGLAARVLGPALVLVRSFGFDREYEVRSVRVEVSRGSVVHRVGVRTSAGPTVWVARRMEIGAVLDITYDGFNRLADARWASALGHRLAAALQVPYEANDTAVT